MSNVVNTRMAKTMLVCILAAGVLLTSALSGAVSDAEASDRCGGTLRRVMDARDSEGEKYGELRIYYEGRGVNCAETVATRFTDRPKYMSVHIRDTGGESDGDSYPYWYSYAGPVRVYAPGQCIKARGGIQNPFTDYMAAVQSPWILCN